MDSSQSMVCNPDKQHLLRTDWSLWAHLPHDTDWSINSYKNIATISTIEAIVTIMESIPEKMITNCRPRRGFGATNFFLKKHLFLIGHKFY